VQAIQVLENAALEAPRRRSPFRALIWKEWRQQRWIFLSTGGLAYVLLVAAVIVVWPDRSKVLFKNGRNEGAELLAAIAVFLGICSMVLLPSNVFAGERDDSTDLFFETIPCSRSKLFWVKLSFVLFLVLLELLPVGTALLVYIGCQPNVHLNELGVRAVGTALVLAVAVLVLAIVPALVASFGGSVIATILGSILGSGICAVWMTVSFSWLVKFVPVNAMMTAGWLCTLLVSTLLLASWRLWSNAERTPRKAERAVAATAGLLIAYVALPIAATYFYMTCLAPLSYFLKSENRTSGAGISTVSPNGKYVICGAWYSGWGWPGRCALLDVGSGRSQWLSRFRSSETNYSQNLWSPSGNQVVVEEGYRWLNPIKDASTKPATFVLDVRSGEKQSFAELCPGLKRMPLMTYPYQNTTIGWYSEQLFAIRDGRDVLFADVKNHKVQRCSMPHALPSASLGNYPQLLITARGIFAAAYGPPRAGMCVFRYAPELSEAETLEMPGIPNTAWLSSVSQDGRRLIISTQVIDPNSHGTYYDRLERYIVRLDDGIELKLLDSPKPNAEGLISPSWPVYGFLRDGHQILLCDGKEVALLDADSHALRRIPIASGASVDSVHLSPSGQFALVIYYSKVEGGGKVIYAVSVVDLKSGTSSNFSHVTMDKREIYPESPEWLGDDHLLFQAQPWLIVTNRDGTGARPLLAN